MRTIAAIILLILFTSGAKAQPGSDSLVFKQYVKVQKQGMLTLGTWAAGNIVLGLTTAQYSEGSRHYFNSMNAYWNTVNLGLATLGYINSRRLAHKPGEYKNVAERIRKTKRVFIINAGLDLVYMGAGYALSRAGGKNPDLNKGFGNAIILQGGFLLGFDALMLWRHNSLAKKLRTF